MWSGVARTLFFAGALFPLTGLDNFANTYTQSELLDLILARDTALADLDSHLAVEEPGRGLLRSLRNPELRYSYGEGRDEGIDDGIMLEEDRDSWEVDLRMFVPNPYEVNASTAEAEASHFALKAASADYLSRKLVLARRLWAELRYTCAMEEGLTGLASFWEAAGQSLSQASADNLSLGPDLVSWQMDRIRFLEAKQEIDSRHRSAMQRLSFLAGVDPGTLKPVFAPLTEVRKIRPSASEGSSQLLSQKARVASERAELAEIQARNIPWVDHLQGSYGELTSDFERESWSVQVAVSLPIFSLLSGNAAEQHARLQAEEASLQLMRQQQQEAVFSVSERVDRKIEMLKLYERDVLPLLTTLSEQLSSSEVQEGASLDRKIGLADSILRGVEAYCEVQLDLEQALIELDALQGVIP